MAQRYYSEDPHAGVGFLLSKLVIGDGKGDLCQWEDVELELKDRDETIINLTNQLNQASNKILDLEDEIKRYKEAFNKFESILAGV